MSGSYASPTIGAHAPTCSLGPSRPSFTSEVPARVGALLQSRIHILRHLGPDAPAAEPRLGHRWESRSQPQPAAGWGRVYPQPSKSPSRTVFCSKAVLQSISLPPRTAPIATGWNEQVAGRVCPPLGCGALARRTRSCALRLQVLETLGAPQAT